MRYVGFTKHKSALAIIHESLCRNSLSRLELRTDKFGSLQTTLIMTFQHGNHESSFRVRLPK